MEDQSDDDLTSSIVGEDGCTPLSPIIEMNESTEVQDEESVTEIKDDLKFCNKVDRKLDLETSVENLEVRLSQPETPPEVLRIRLNSLQNDYEELKEFTDLERQVIHSDCIPRDEVHSVEAELALLNDKVQHLIRENSEYQSKLEIKEDEQQNLKSEIAKSLNLQKESVILIEQMKKKLNEDIKDASMIKEIELLPPSSFLEKCGENIEVPHVVGVDAILNSLRDLSDLLKITSNEKKELCDKVGHLQLSVLELNGTVERKNREITDYQQSLTSAKTDIVNFQEKLANIDKELAGISNTLSASENKQLEAESIKYVINKELDDTQEQILSIVTMLENFVHSLYDDSDNSFVTHENLAAIENNLRNSRDLFGISNTLANLEQIFHKLKREVKFKKEESYELQLNIEQLNDHLRKYEEDVSERKVEIEFLQQEINQRIPSRLLELNNCLSSKDCEISRLKNNLKAAYAKVDELSNRISESTIKMDEMEALLVKKSLEKTNLENEIFKLNDCLTIDNIQHYIILAVKCLENVVDSWDEKSNLGDLVTALQEKQDISNVTNLLMNVDTRVIFSEVAKKYKVKLLLHDKKTNTLYSKLKTMTSDIDHLESENEKIRLEVNALDHIVREGISNRVNDLEKLLCCSDQEKLVHESTKQNVYSGDNYEALFIPEEDRQKEDLNPLEASYISCDKLQKQINNFNKATKPDDGVENNMCDLNEIENLIDSWNCSGKIQVREFTQLLNEKLIKYCDKYQNSKAKVDIFRIINKFEVKLMELFELNNQLLKTVKSFSNFVENNENKQYLYTCTNEDLQWMSNVFKEKERSVNDYCEKKHEHDRAEEIKTIKELMCVEITSLDETEDKGSLMCDSVENIFSKLIQTIMKKEQEMSYSLMKQQKEDIHNFEKTIEKLNNKLKSQESWTNTLESENEKINTELIALKSLNNSFDHKLKALSNDINNKTLEVDIMKRKISDLTTENCSLISDLDEAKELINKYINSVSCLEKDIEKLNEDNSNKSNVIKHLASKLTSDFDEQEHLDSKIDTLSSNFMSINAKRDSVTVGVNQVYDSKFSNVIIEGCSYSVKGHKENIFDFETGLSEMLRKETSFINDMLKRGGKNVAFSELFSRCHENLIILKDLIQNIGSKISELELSHDKDLQSIQTALEYKTKEMIDLKLSISNLFWDLVTNRVEMRKGEITNESFQQCSITSIQNEVDQIKSECDSLSNRINEFDDLAKVGQNIVQNLRESLQAIVDENNNMTKLILDLRESIECEKKKANRQKEIANGFTNENKMLIEQNYLLENEKRDLKSELSRLKREMFLELNICFPDKMEKSEKVTYINNTLKQYAETQEVCYAVTEELRFFGYHCELMLSYIQSLEYKMCFTTQQKEHLGKENTLLKGQLTTQHLEMNRFFNQLISKSPFAIQTQNQALEVISHIFSEYKLLKENNIKLVNEDKVRQENMLQLQKELILLTKQNSSLKFELTTCEDSIRNLRSELRKGRSKYQRKENTSVDFTEVKQEKTDATVQTEGTCCKRLQKKITEQKEKIDILATKLSKNENRQRSSVTSNPYNKQVSYLEGALGQAKERIGRLYLELKQQESHNQELVEALKRHESCQQRLNEANKEIEKLKRDK